MLPENYQPQADLLRNRVVLITGAGDGIGRACAIACAAHGATTVLVGRTVKKLEQVYDQIEQAGHPQPAIYPLNLEGATPKDYFDLAQVLSDEFGRLDGLVHNAAMLFGLTPIANYDPEIWYRTLQINLNGPFLLTQALLGPLRRAEQASVLFTIDRVSNPGRAYWGAYAVAKAGLKTLMEVLSQELENNTSVRVNAVDPGPARTRLRLQAYPAGNRDSWAAPESLMPLYLYLLGPDSARDNINGQSVQLQRTD